jgi:hypothetical protein
MLYFLILTPYSFCDGRYTPIELVRKWPFLSQQTAVYTFMKAAQDDVRNVLSEMAVCNVTESGEVLLLGDMINKTIDDVAGLDGVLGAYVTMNHSNSAQCFHERRVRATASELCDSCLHCNYICAVYRLFVCFYFWYDEIL